ncbi:hypothetical protein K2173_021752 [Erythroxylum novogranatense]|uniref:GATA-type domain-containing protein n=1 Tax=Erythroxylum novogranatense TaxID=1862640 RepID=A0AAV8TVC0_9ROSI|nr:hypothetical protein K2173_021752 [Erythroxylum novogranatense]
MDSPWLYQTSEYTGSSSRNQEDIGDSLDLTLKLGFSGEDQLGDEHVGSDPDLNLNLNLGLYNHQSFRNFYTTNLPGVSSNGDENPWPSSELTKNQPNQLINSSEVDACMNTAMRYGAPYNPHSNINGFNQPATTSPVTPVVYNDHTPLNSTTKNGVRDSGSSSSCRRNLYNDPNKRCTNCFCGARDTPMWRRGPQGPKTLCNACGIKFRKEEERKAREKTNNWNKQQSRNG